jgi:hypothetical protein
LECAKLACAFKGGSKLPHSKAFGMTFSDD